jgi:hypothetical protein
MQDLLRLVIVRRDRPNLPSDSSPAHARLLALASLPAPAGRNCKDWFQGIQLSLPVFINLAGHNKIYYI